MSEPEEPTKLQYESATDPADVEPDRRWTIRAAVLTAGLGPFTTLLSLIIGGTGTAYIGIWSIVAGALVTAVVSVVALTVVLVLNGVGRTSRARGIATGLLLGLGLNILIFGGCFVVTASA